jgi:hypothetical protein
MKHQAEIDARQVMGNALKSVLQVIESYEPKQLKEMEIVWHNMMDDMNRPEYERRMAGVLLSQSERILSDCEK